MDDLSLLKQRAPESPAIQSFALAGARNGIDSATAAGPVAVLTGGGDRPYALGLAAALISQGISFDFIASDELDDPELRRSPLVHVFNLRKEMRSNVSAVRKVVRVFAYYLRLIVYAAKAKPKLFHILWNNKFAILDRTLLMLYYRALRKRIILTLHNVNAGQRDGNDNFVNRLTLRIQYLLADHLFVHTEQMRKDLRKSFGLPDANVSVIPFGINSTVPNTDLTSSEARQRLELTGSHKVVLFFGNIAPYKGLEHLIDAMALLTQRSADYRLVVAGRPKNCQAYWQEIQRQLSNPDLRSYVTQRIEYVPDADTEIYFKAADVLVLPYTHVFQSGVLFLGYNFGLPVIASDVGSLKEDIIEGKTGFVCKPRDPVDLSKCIETYFSSELYRELDTRRQDIKYFAAKTYSWTTVGEITQSVYKKLLAQR
jgi:glycosyltransferase involved in cell wall biosynthesis